MLTHFFLTTLAVSGATILWRTIKDDHPRFKAFVIGLPLVGPALQCGICISYWFSLAALAVVDPLPGWRPALPHGLGGLEPLLMLGIVWFALGTAVLFTRSLIIVQLEAGGILKHRHLSIHATK
jgi:hypothetical protein